MNANHPVLAWLENQLKDKKKTSLRAVKRDYAKLTGFISLSTQLTFPLLGLETLELKDLLFQNVWSDDIKGSDKLLCQLKMLKRVNAERL